LCLDDEKENTHNFGEYSDLCSTKGSCGNLFHHKPKEMPGTILKLNT
jgi:hypothetical protein